MKDSGENMNDRLYLNNGWQFFEKFSDEQLSLSCDASSSVSVRLPHTCKELPFNYFDESLYQMECAYRRVFRAENAWKDKRVLLTVDGAAHDSEVFLNGKSIASHHCGYTAFTVDLSDFLDFSGDNVLVIRVDSRENLNVPPFGFAIDYMTYGGIYRDVYIDVKEDIYFKDIFLKPKVLLEKKNSILISDFLLNKNGENISVRQSISCHKKDDFSEIGNFSFSDVEPTDVSGSQSSGARVASSDGASSVQSENAAPSGADAKFSSQVDLDSIKLWSPDEPNLYDVKNELFVNGTKVDEKIITVGFREALFKSDGFYLNGKKFKFRGLNRHQSYPYVGYAMPKSMQEFDAEVLKNELGCNAVRTSHYPQSHYFIDKCDEIGLLVFTEIPGWQHIGNDEWKNQAVQNVRDMIVQWRNHASIILWGVRINESKDDDDFYKKTNEVAHELDSTRQTAGVKAHKKAHTFEDVYTYNDFVHSGSNEGCNPKKNVVPDMSLPYFVSEYNGHMFPTKTFDCEEHRRDHALRHANVLDAIAEHDDICGSFGWCMADYNTHKDFGSGDRICYHGVLDMWRNPKMAASVYSSQQDKEPVLEVASSMDIGEHPACFRGSTYIFTNADSVRMYKNDRFIKEYKKEDSSYKHLAHGPILIDDFIGDAVEKGETDFSKAQAKAVKTILNLAAVKGMSMSGELLRNALKLVLVYHMNPASAVGYFNKYVGDWGGISTTYKFEAVKDGNVVKTVHKGPMKKMHLGVQVSHTELYEEATYDVASVRIAALDENGNVLSFYNEPLKLSVLRAYDVSGVVGIESSDDIVSSGAVASASGELPIEIIGPDVISLQGGLFGTYIKTTGKKGKAILRIETVDKSVSSEKIEVAFTVNI